MNPNFNNPNDLNYNPAFNPAYNPNQPQFNQQNPNQPHFNPQNPNQPNFGYGFAPYYRPQNPSQNPNESYTNLLLGGTYPPQQFGFPSFNAGPQTPSTPRTSHTQVTPASEPDVESVPETQYSLDPEPQVDPETTAMERRRKSKKKVVRNDEEAFPGKPIKWNKVEAVCLVNCYLGISEDEEVGNAQPADHFWMRILRIFHEKMDRGIYRNQDMLSSKFREAVVSWNHT